MIMAEMKFNPLMKEKPKPMKSMRLSDAEKNPFLVELVMVSAGQFMDPPVLVIQNSNRFFKLTMNKEDGTVSVCESDETGTEIKPFSTPGHNSFGSWEHPIKNLRSWIENQERLTELCLLKNQIDELWRSKKIDQLDIASIQFMQMQLAPALKKLTGEWPQ